MIPAETQYNMHDGKFLAIIKVFNTWRYYLKGCKHKVLVLIDHNNLRRFMNTKSLSFQQVYWAQKLSQYNFRINYCQGKANTAADALFVFFQRIQDEENELRVGNGQIFYCLQNLLTNASLARLSFSFLSSSSLPLNLHQVFVYGTYVLL